MYINDPYVVLSVLPDADEKTVQKAYRTLMKKIPSRYQHRNQQHRNCQENQFGL